MAPDETNPPDDALKRLGARLEQASEAAERLIDEAAARIKPPPSGWQAPDAGSDAGSASGSASADVALVLQTLREFVPSDLQRRLAEAVRELLLAIRAMIDWYVERLEQRRSQPVQVQDIPVL